MGTHARRAAAAVDGFVLRAAQAADLVEVAAIERAAYSDPWPGSAFAALPENPSVFFSVARSAVDGAVAGYVVGWHVMQEAELANLAVEPRWRRRGIARALLDAMLADADRRTTERVFLEVRESNEAARRLYASRGFREVGRRRKYYRRPDEDALVLRRDRAAEGHVRQSDDDGHLANRGRMGASQHHSRQEAL